VDRLPEQLKCTVHEMLKELESDKAAGRYIVWLRFTHVFTWKNRNKVKDSLTEFFQGEFICYHSLLIFSQFVLLLLVLFF